MEPADIKCNRSVAECMMVAHTSRSISCAIMKIQLQTEGSRIDGFNPEYGAPCLPTVECLREMMDEKDLWPINKEVWDYSDGNDFI
jgi:hypothetical protein